MLKSKMGDEVQYYSGKLYTIIGLQLIFQKVELQWKNKNLDQKMY